MLVKAKWNVKTNKGWRSAGEVFQTEEDLGNAVEIIDAQKATKPQAEPVKASALAGEEPKAQEATAKPKTTRRKKAGE